MSKVWTIAIKDFKGYFSGPVAWVVMTFFTILMGYFFFNAVGTFYEMSAQYQKFGMNKTANLTEGVIRPLYGNMNVIYLFTIPLITMRLFAEEKRNHTFELLATSPLTLTQMILGKYLSAVMMIAVILALTFVYPVILFMTGNPELGPIVACYIGTFLIACASIAIGTFFSATTENQIVSAMLTFGTLLFLWLIGWAARSAGPVWGELLQYLSLIGHFHPFTRGEINSSDVVFYVSFSGLGLYMTHRILDSYRWR